MKKEIREYLSRIGRRGGLKSRRALGSDTAREMVRVREARRAYRRFHAKCFWSFDPEYPVTSRDVPWIADQLRRHGGREEWEIASKLCR